MYVACMLEIRYAYTTKAFDWLLKYRKSNNIKLYRKEKGNFQTTPQCIIIRLVIPLCGEK